MEQRPEQHDVVIVGAGLSGIAAAVQLRTDHPERSFVVLDQRADLGGTWDLFRYPGIRSDSDMYTLGYAFKPWTSEKAIASGDAILGYLHETVAEHDLASHLRLGRRVRSADWSEGTRSWTLEAEGPDGPESFTCSFLYLASGYYDHDGGHRPELPGVERYGGLLVHPQEWPLDLDCSGKRVAVIGSGATAITLVPALAEVAEKVTMVQRSPTYVAIDSDVDDEAQRLRHEVGDRAAFEMVRLRNLQNQQERYQAARAYPEEFKKPLFDAIEEIVGRDVREQHFTPSYQPWDQRLCLVPNGDLFHAIAKGQAEVVTGHIETFTASGIRMESGEEVEADVVVTATGLELVNFGKIDVRFRGPVGRPRGQVHLQGRGLQRRAQPDQRLRPPELVVDAAPGDGQPVLECAPEPDGRDRRHGGGAGADGRGGGDDGAPALDGGRHLGLPVAPPRLLPRAG
ncbi:NAD(P)/FAD-dependent oxidoreductase [Nocardioides sp. QY071]|uniref:flavin-containing monooxygenase n=1 Tax=Nocardioides sp. QY071 TaxID=3044187 RepID=UPI00249A5471|nr:NAD(P)/FAD-dependent oxidoreductase [Nocardioides sp. QY071]WGY02845.1 NAD(P)/FAD-dependent oxidoreductase [Nocardioides sp. QY071]